MEARNRHSVDRNSKRDESEIVIPDRKRCSSCKQTKQSNEFHRAKREKDGLKSYCKACAASQRRKWYRRNAASEVAKSYAWQKAHPDKVKTHARATYRRNHASRLERGKQYYAKKRDRISAENRNKYANDAAYRQRRIASAKACYRKRAAKLVAYRKKYRVTHADQVSINALAARCRKHKAPGKCTANEWQGILDYYNHHCAYCLEHESVVGKLTIDHIDPLTRGGSNDPDNLVPACKVCNSSKNNRTILEFAGGLSARRSATY